MRDISRKYGVPMPVIECDDDWFSLTMPRSTGEVTGEVVKMLMVLDKPMSAREIQADLGLKSQENFRKRYLQPALEALLIEMLIPDKPKSRLQKYRLTEMGRAFIDK